MRWDTRPTSAAATLRGWRALTPITFGFALVALASVVSAETRAPGLQPKPSLPSAARQVFGEAPPPKLGLTRDFGFVVDSLRRSLRLVERDERKLAALVDALDGLSHTQVHIRVSSPDPFAALHGTPTIVSVTIVTHALGGANTSALTAQVRKTAATTLRIEPSRVGVVIDRATRITAVPRARTQLSAIGPLRVAPESRTTIIALLVGLLLAVIVLAAIVGVLLWRRPRILTEGRS